MSTPAFLKATPVWAEGHREDWNQFVGFHACWTPPNAPASPHALRIAAADCYRVWCNGSFAGYGPARAAHGYARVDEWALDAFLREGVNHLAIEVCTYGIDSYVYAMQPAFVLAEVVSGDEVVVATGKDFDARLLPERIRRVERFSKQRPFAEAYRLTPDCNDWRTGGRICDTIRCAAVAQPRLLPRHVRLPRFDCVQPRAVVEDGMVVEKDEVTALPKETRRDGVGVRVMGYPVDELEIDMTRELNALAYVLDSGSAPACASSSAPGAALDAARYTLYDFGIVQGGFIGVRLRGEAPTRVYLQFDEVRERDAGQAFALGVGAIALDIEAGEHCFESMEPYGFRFLRVLSLDAAIAVDAVWVREYTHPLREPACASDDPESAAILRAAWQTFRTNSIDLFTDCMSRERGGYPCDAWFTARAEHVLAGESRVERNFLENYFLVDTFASIPDGMVPHCYPSDRLGKGQYIPNWGLWLVLQLCAYCRRTGDTALRNLARPRVEALVAWFAPHRNEIGLLEDVPGWVFVEWSAANECTDAVNYPTNMLYAHTLAEAGQVYERCDWVTLAEQTRQAIREESWDGVWFADQSVRVDGTLQRTGTRTETCQYHALIFGAASIESHPELWQRLRDGWGPLDGGTNADNGVGLVPAGLLYGLMLRFDLLQQAGEWQRLLEEVRRVFGPMAAASGTLWEHLEPRSSLNHGFAACACEYLYNAERVSSVRLA